MELPNRHEICRGTYADGLSGEGNSAIDTTPCVSGVGRTILAKVTIGSVFPIVLPVR